ncbi:unnamed protein product [Mytilus coruscus]|uniref:Mab-21-like HhH/H2TH-like domain-containing protein n=1 Tax=Mytilus coruscus TaxID=42192 RepID=A0A6J8AA20_MYTCO|nr:unnamed protein product [Mytilus coruscus]
MDDISILYQRVLKKDHQKKGNELNQLNVKHTEKDLSYTNEAEQTSVFDNCKSQENQCKHEIASHIQMISWKSNLLSNVKVNKVNEKVLTKMAGPCNDRVPIVGEFGPILAVHSNMYIEKRRDHIRNVAKQINKANRPYVSYMKKTKTHTRPQWPFQPWISCTWGNELNPDVFLSLFDPFVDPHTESKRLPRENLLQSTLKVDQSKINYQFIDSVCKENMKSSQEEHDQEYVKVVNDMKGMLKTVYGILAEKHKVFHHYNIIGMGSMAEGTKIGNPDEFDFMIELPCLNEALEVLEPPIYDSLQSDEKKPLGIKKRKLFDDFEDIDQGEEKDQHFLKRVWNAIQMETANILETNAVPGWKWLDTVPIFMTGLAQTHTLLFSGEKWNQMVVHVDLCLCFKPQNFNNPMNVNQEILDKTRPGITTPREKAKERYDYLILRSDGEARWTRAVREKEIWYRYSSSNGRKVVYRCLKYAVSTCIPRKYNEALFRTEPLVPSYWIKTIVYFMMTYFWEDTFWTEDKITTRFSECFLMLIKCLTEKNLSSYFIPHNVLSKFFPTFVKSSDLEEEYKNILEQLKVLNEAIFFQPVEFKDKNVFQLLWKKAEEMSKIETENGRFKSVIELCYFYAYNDFSDENFKALCSFIELFMPESVQIHGRGSEFQLTYRETNVDLNSKISEYYGDDTEYFEKRDCKT